MSVQEVPKVLTKPRFHCSFCHATTDTVFLCSLDSTNPFAPAICEECALLSLDRIESQKIYNADFTVQG